MYTRHGLGGPGGPGAFYMDSTHACAYNIQIAPPIVNHLPSVHLHVGREVKVYPHTRGAFVLTST